MRKRVVVTGIGCVNPMGHDVETVWKGLLAGESGVGHTTIFDASSFPTRIAAEVKDWSVRQVGEDPAVWQRCGRHTRFAVGAAKQAIRDSGLDLDQVEPTQFGVYLGSGEGNQDFESFTRIMTAALTPEGLDHAAFAKAGLELLDPVLELEQEPHMPSGHLAALFNAQGPNYNCLTACAASSQAIGEATEIIRRGEATVMLAGGAHSMIHPFGVTGFNLLTALSTRNDAPTRASRPFDRKRDGFVLGEGAAMVVLEEHDQAVRRGAPILGEILGFGSTADAYRITDIHPEGRGAIRCMQMAMQDANCGPESIHYVNAHGTSTTVNDRVETIACKGAFGSLAPKIPISSTKSMMGHLIAAAGVTELIVCLMSIRDGVLPPTTNYEEPDPECDLDYIPNQPRETKCDIALNNSFGFGGQNITLIVGRYSP
ncbi:MAG: beta-ketoacyl-[acyl-carrier-protein] synthase family protein [Planctomycetota bacterium]|nr:beta-ketoacyl-[acyl-carrier-protein] synthase family protein [Planctomycetota bacterium]MDA1179907.1 beta-ketoacyl-[acyl-carrier-protein] synthase family protein [Planctomycetota bacterium]